MFIKKTEFIQVRVSMELYKTLKRYCEFKKITMSKYIRNIIEKLPTTK